MRENILIIDDNEHEVNLLSGTLGGQYKLYQASNWEAAQDLLSQVRVNLIIAKINRALIDGFGICRFIKSDVRYCHIPFVLLSAKNTYRTFIKGLKVGADAYIQLPSSPELVQLQVANLLKNRSYIKTHFAHSPFEDVRVTALSQSDEAFLRKLEAHICKNIKDTTIDIKMLSAYMNMSRATFYRKIKTLSSLSPKELIDLTRLKKAAQLMVQNEYKLFEIAQMVGFSSQSSFIRIFQRHFKITPMAYINQLQEKQQAVIVKSA
jgi:AraC-like DNA-binding protein